MKKILILVNILIFISAFTAVSNELQKSDERQDLSNLVRNLEKQNTELRIQLRVLDNELKHTQTIQSQAIDSLMGLLKDTQKKMLETSDTLSKTYFEISTVKSKSEAQNEWFGSSIARNRAQMLIFFLILLITFSILYYLLNKNLHKNALLVQNKFQAAYEDFDDNIKTASALLNKHIKETRDLLDEEVKQTHVELDKQINNRRTEVNQQIDETSRIMDSKIEENKHVLDKHVEETKKSLSDEIEKAAKNFENQLNSLKSVFDEHIKSNYKSICTEFNERISTLSDTIEHIKKEIDSIKTEEN